MSTKKVEVHGELMVHFVTSVWVGANADDETDEICSAALLKAEKEVDIKIVDGKLFGTGPEGLVALRIPDDEPDWYRAEQCDDE